MSGKKNLNFIMSGGPLQDYHSQRAAHNSFAILALFIMSGPYEITNPKHFRTKAVICDRRTRSRMEQGAAVNNLDWPGFYYEWEFWHYHMIGAAFIMSGAIFNFSRTSFEVV